MVTYDFKIIYVAAIFTNSIGHLETDTLKDSGDLSKENKTVSINVKLL